MKDNTKTYHELFHSYCSYPDIHFETQHRSEKVILVLRAHPITQISWLINSLIFFIFLIFLNFIPLSFFSLSQIIFINIFGTFIILSYLWFNFLSWFFNVGIVTSERIIDIDFHMILYKEVTASRLDRIEDITSKSGGYLASFFDYGNVFVQTAGTEANIEFFNIPHPSRVVQIINGLLARSHGS